MATVAPDVSDRAYRRVINSWAMYDWANSAFFTIIVTAIYPLFYRSLVMGAGLGPHDATAFWAYTNSISLVVVAFLGPVLGAISDHTGGKKRYIAFFVSLGVLSTASLIFLGSDTYLLGSILFILGMLSFSGGNIFYESLLPLIARKGDIDQVSTRGFAVGYIGGGLLLVLNSLCLAAPHWFLMPSRDFALRACFLSTALWWGLFTIPLFINVPAPPPAIEGLSTSQAVRAGIQGLVQTIRRIRNYKQLVLFLIAFWIYNDGITTIMRMATAYGQEIGIKAGDMLMALILTQFVGVPCSFGFGRLARRWGTKPSILCGLAVYGLITILGFFMRSAWQFYLLAIMVGLVQGGTQALSRSFYGVMVPKTQSAEFFGFYSISSKFGGFVGPLLFGLVGQIFGNSRLSILAISSFFFIGGYLLHKVNEQEGIRIARVEEEKTKLAALESSTPNVAT